MSKRDLKSLYYLTESDSSEPEIEVIFNDEEFVLHYRGHEARISRSGLGADEVEKMEAPQP